MRFRQRLATLAGISAIILSASGAAAQEAQDAPAKAEAKPGEPSVTHHSMTLDGRTLQYTVTAGMMDLPDYEGQKRAEVFYIAYTLDGDHDPASRPLTFSFNGGPGSSSVWLHLGLLGPRRVDMGDDQGFGATPPYRLVANEHSWLDLSDVVFIDPVGTGYSRPAEGVNKRDFHGLEEDISSVGDFIRLWTSREQRWSSPKFLIGESYGTTRAAGLSGYLQDTHGMFLNGIILVSPILNFQTARFDVGNDEPFWLYLPTYAATAFYHGRLQGDLARSLRQTVQAAREFAENDYLRALARGDELPPSERDRIATRLSQLTGLSKEFILDTDLRIGLGSFCKGLLRDQSRTVGRLDSRYRGIDRLDIGEGFEYDPSYSAIQGPYTATINDYIRRDLGYENDHPYEILTGRVNPWSYDRFENRYVNVSDTLRSAMSKNPSLKVMVSCGYYDFATPFFAAEYTISHLGLDPALRPNIRIHHYEAGHMMYVRLEDLAALKTDAAAFYADALPK